MSLKVEVTLNECCAVLKLKGRITLGEGSVTLRDEAKLLVASGRTRLVLDVSEVNYIDSSGFGTLYTDLWPWTHNAGGEFVLVNPTKKVLELLDITKLRTVQGIFPTTSEAIEYFCKRIHGKDKK